MKNETQKEKNESVNTDSAVTTRISILESDLKILKLEGKKTKEIRDTIRETLGLPKLKANTQKAKALSKLGLDNNASVKEVWAKLNEEN